MFKKPNTFIKENKNKKIDEKGSAQLLGGKRVLKANCKAYSSRGKEKRNGLCIAARGGEKKNGVDARKKSWFMAVSLVP